MRIFIAPPSVGTPRNTPEIYRSSCLGPLLMPMALNRRFISTYRYAEVVISRDLRLHALDEGLGAQVALVLELGPGGWVVLAFGHEGSIALNSAPALPREGGKQPVGVQPWRRLRQAGRGSIAAPAGKRQDLTPVALLDPSCTPDPCRSCCFIRKLSATPVFAPPGPRGLASVVTIGG